MEIKKILFLFIKPNILRIFYLIFCFLLFSREQTNSPNIHFIKAIKLKNGNILAIKKDGIFIYDQYWNNTKKISKFYCTFNEDDLSKIEIEKFTEENFDLIISIIIDAIYIFNNTGGILIEEFSQVQYPFFGEYYNIIPIKKNESEYNYAIAQVSTIGEIFLNFYIFNYYNNSNIFINSFKVIDLKLEEKTLSCHLMSNLSDSIKNETIVCFYHKNWNMLGRFFVEIKNYSITHQGNFTTKEQIKFLKSKVNSKKNKSLICFGYSRTQKSNCTIYSFENDSFSEFNEYEVYCGEKYYLSKIDYIQQTNQFLFYCSNTSEITLARFDKDFNYISQNDDTEILSATNINYFSLLNLGNSCNYTILYYNESYILNIISIYINDEDNKCEVTNQFINSNTSSMMASTDDSTFNNNSINNSINFDHTNSISINSSQISSINTHSIEEYPPYITNNIFSSTTMHTSYKLSSKINDYDTSNYTYYSSPTTSVGTLPSTQYIKEDTIDIKKEELTKELDKIIDKIDIGKIYKKIGEDYSILIYPTNSTYLTTTTHVNFSQCESILRKTLNIPESSIITFLQIELENEDSKSLINQVEYQAYIDNHTPLNLSLCNDATIQVFYSIKNNSIIDFISADSFKDLGVDIFNIRDSFFNDICEPYSESNNDLILDDRIKDIFQNYSLCEEGCTYNEIDLENKIISCDCKVKSTVTTNISSLNLEEAEGSSTNFEVIKCYNLVFSLEGKLDNIGFWILTFLVLAHFPILFYYFKRGVKPVKDYILKEMEEYGYIKENKKIKKKFKNNENNNIKKSQKHKKKIKNNKSNVGPPPKHKNEKSENQNNLITKDLKLIDNSSSFNIIKSTKREIFPKNKDDINKKGIKHNKSSTHKNNKILENKKSNISKKILFKNNTQSNKKLKTKKHDNMSKLPTQTLNSNIIELNNSNLNEKNKNHNNYSLIKMNINLNRDQNFIPPNSNIILNNYTFEEAIKYDKRQLCEIFYIFALAKQIFFHTFLYRSPLELFSLRLILFIFIISCDLSLNALFYFNENISKKYRKAKNVFIFTYTDNIVIIFLSILVGFVLLTLLAKLSNSTSTIREVFLKEEEKLKSNKKYTITQIRKTEILLEIEQILKKHKMRVIIFIIIEFILMLFFWYFVTAFCHVYNATQISWLWDSLTSILIRAIIELLISLGLAKLYIMAIVAECHCLYKFLMLLYNLG